MTVQFQYLTHPLINRNGYSLWLPGRIIKGLKNFKEPDIYSEDLVQQYPLGTKLEFADGRVFRYGKHGATSTSPPMARMVMNANLCPGAPGDPDVDGFEGDLHTAAVAGDEDVDLEIATAYAENFFEDGMLAVFTDSSPAHYVEYRIAGSELGDGTYCRVYLEKALKKAITATEGITAYKSLFSQLKVVGAEGGGFVSAMGASLCSPFTVNYFSWIQRRGRCIITPTAYFGDTADERMAQMHSDGTIALKAGHGTHTVGYLTQRTELNYGDLEVWLQLE